jgi:hypothetical protein
MYKLTPNNDIVYDLTNQWYIPVDRGNRHYQEYLKWVSLGNTPDPAYSEAELFELNKLNMTTVVQNYLDEIAQQYGYDSILSACLYSASSNSYQQEGISFLNWRSACWQVAISILNDVENNIRTIPTSQELINELPIYQP